MSNKTNLSAVMTDANIIKKVAKVSRSTAMKKAYLVAALNAILAEGKVAKIVFEKADGTLREMNALPASVGEPLVKGDGRKTPQANKLVVDANLGEFRSFKKANLISVEAA